MKPSQKLLMVSPLSEFFDVIALCKLKQGVCDWKDGEGGYMVIVEQLTKRDNFS